MGAHFGVWQGYCGRTVLDKVAEREMIIREDLTCSFQGPADNTTSYIVLDDLTAK